MLGSAIYNSTATLGIAALVRPLPVPGIAAQAWLAALPAAQVTWSLAAGRVGRLAGLLLLAAYLSLIHVTGRPHVFGPVLLVLAGTEAVFGAAATAALARRSRLGGA